MKEKVAVALSGGLDSAVAASLLIEENFQVIGLHFSTGYEASSPTSSSSNLTPRRRAENIASSMGIPLEVVDCSRAFSEKVVDYFLETYISGETHNPCVVCNRRIKFGVVLDFAGKLGAHTLATGHYARRSEGSRKTCHLLKGVDSSKDQSYFLSRLRQQQLNRALFPLGNFTKNRVREMALDRGFKAYTGNESQELCFIDDSGYRDFLTAHGVRTGGPGPVVNSRGEVLGQHKGLFRHTIGQRRGLGIPGPEPYYVLRIDPSENQLVIGTKEELAANTLTVTRINWIGMDAPHEPLTVKTRIRYRHQEVPSVVSPVDEKTATVAFREPQYAITPGQAAVFYDGERVLGGGWISTPELVLKD